MTSVIVRDPTQNIIVVREPDQNFAVIHKNENKVQILTAGTQGAPGPAMTFDMLTDEQKAELKGEPGQPFDTLTPEQQAALKGEAGRDGISVTDVAMTAGGHLIVTLS